MLRRILDALWLPNPARCEDPAAAKAALRGAMTRVNRTLSGRVAWLVVAVATATFIYGWRLRTGSDTPSIRGWAFSGAASCAGTLALWYWGRCVRLELHSRHSDLTCGSGNGCSTSHRPADPSGGGVTRWRLEDRPAPLLAASVVVALGVLAQWFTNSYAHDTSGMPYGLVFLGFVFQSIAGFGIAALFFVIAFVVHFVTPVHATPHRLVEVLMRSAVYMCALAFAILVVALAMGLVLGKSSS